MINNIDMLKDWLEKKRQEALQKGLRYDSIDTPSQMYELNIIETLMGILDGAETVKCTRVFDILSRMPRDVMIERVKGEVCHHIADYILKNNLIKLEEMPYELGDTCKKFEATYIIVNPNNRHLSELIESSDKVSYTDIDPRKEGILM